MIRRHPSGQRRPRVLIAVLALALAVGGALAVYRWRSAHAGLPSPSSAAYEEVTRRFYRGLAKLEVGLLDDAAKELSQATTLAPGEPAVWADLGLVQLRLGQLDAAAVAIARAAELVPKSGAVAYLQARLETLRGDRDAAVGHLRRAVELDAGNLQARMALLQEVEAAGGEGGDDEAQRLLEEVVVLQPDNLAVLVERARLAAKRHDGAQLADSLQRLGRFAGGWPAEVVAQYETARRAGEATDFAAAARALAFLRNLLAQVPAYREDRRRVTPPDDLVAQPLTRFLRLPVPESRPAPADEALAFALEPAGEGAAPPAGVALLAASLDGAQPPALFVAAGGELRRADGTAPPLPLPAGPAGTPATPAALLALDWDNDFRTDLVAAGAGGVRLFLQAADGTFRDATAAASAAGAAPALDATGAWAADVEMDGDLDLVVGVRGAAAVVLRNNGDGTWTSIQPFGAVRDAKAFAWGDLDDDGDPDAALLDGAGALHVLANEQGGSFAAAPAPPGRTGLSALALGDLDGDGRFDLVTLGGGVVRRADPAPPSHDAGAAWDEEEWASWPEAPRGGGGPAGLFLADLDANGALDVVASAGDATAVWLAGEDRRPRRLGAAVALGTWSVADLDGDNHLDLAGLAGGQPVRALARGTRGYHVHVLRARAQSRAGDQRVNSFGVGGTVEARAGRLVQKRAIAGPDVHFGLGPRTSVDVTRVVWPNGVPQAEFDPAVDRSVVAEQRLKGSCPWVFAFDGSRMRFVTDFLWRSPLGLRINAQDTADVTQTEDWVKIRGDQLAPRDGVYDVRISAELWETHYVDHVALLAVDRPRDVEVFVDERFVPVMPPALTVHATAPPRAVARAWDESGADVSELVARRDGRYLATFARGRYQGVAADHFVEVELDAPIDAEGPAWLIAHGWIYPTDSSINVAIAQGDHPRPRGLSLEARDATGRWMEVASGLGFPAGKSKTVLIDLTPLRRAGLAETRRLRLRTNLEVYWDSIAYARGVPEAPLLTRRLAPSRAALRHRGFSVTNSARRDMPEEPIYDRIANTAPRWRDLEGWHTRFGDVLPLLTAVEDRYVIMNAGDELRLQFPALPPPRTGWARDFVLVGDGWEKDGDFNTGHSRTVLPLPSHAQPRYGAASASPALEEDPVYRRHRADWQTFHTRYVTPRAFLDGLWFDDDRGRR